MQKSDSYGRCETRAAGLDVVDGSSHLQYVLRRLEEPMTSDLG